jgi:lysozyme family protein
MLNNKSKIIGYCFLGAFLLLDVFVYNHSHATHAVVEINNMASDVRFQIAMKTILRHEGGLSNDKNDPGGITKYGISLRYLKAEHLCENGDCKGDKNEIITLTQTEADLIYYRDWYEKYHYDQIINQKILTKILDSSVNMGAGQAHKLIKRALNKLYFKQITVDCIMDNQTLLLINHTNPNQLYLALIREEVLFYQSIVKRNPHLKVFLKGWITRAND